MASEEKRPKNRGGRPPKSDDGTLSRTMAFRLRPALEEQLRASALLQGRSMSEEVEARLTRSTQREAAFAEIFGSPEQQSLLVAIGYVVRLADAMSDGPDDSTVQARAAVIHLIEKLADKKASAVCDEAAEVGLEWRTAAENVALLEKGVLQSRKTLVEIKGR